MMTLKTVRILLAATALAAGTSGVIRAAETLPPISQRILAKESQETPHFQRHVVPVLGKLGCNGRACHGSFQGQGGFRLSLFGYDFKMDHENLTKGENPRADVEVPTESLMLEKPTLAIPHKGGKRMEVGSWEYTVLHRWIAGGAKGLPSDNASLKKLEVSPREIVHSEKGHKTQLKAVAVWSDGTREDVTDLCRFQSNDEQIAQVDAGGVVSMGEKGDSHVVVFYDNGVVPVPVMHPVTDRAGENYPEVPAPTTVDRLVVNKLRKLGVTQSELCTDAEFLRRVSFDITGSLPTAREVEAFLADSSADKRSKKIDELLERPTYAAWWTTRLCDMTGNNDDALVNITPVRTQATQDWYDWIYRRVAENRPYDELIAGIVLATSRKPEQSMVEYCKELSDLYRPKSGMSYADRDGLAHFWARRTVTQPAQKALSFAHSFLGVRIQCAECHKHPFDQWTQDDYKQFTRFFERVGYGVRPDSRKDYAAIQAELGLENLKGNELRKEFPKLLAEGKTIPFNEVFVTGRPRPQNAGKPNKNPNKANKPEVRKAVEALKPGEKQPTQPVQAALLNRKKAGAKLAQRGKNSKPDTIPVSSPVEAKKPETAKPAVVQKPAPKPAPKKANKAPAPPAVQPKLLGGDVVDLAKYDDPRQALMSWLRDKKNPYFAKAFVNRVWSAYFEVGIVEPADDLSLANPPSNQELLDYLAQGFIEHNYDMKWLHREIANSRTYQLSWKPNDSNKLDTRNFARAVPRRLPAEVAYDAVRQAGASDAEAARMQREPKGRAIALAGAGRRVAGSPAGYAMTVFGRSLRESNCDCDRSDEPTLLQTVYLRNDQDVLTSLNNQPKTWLAEVTRRLTPAPPVKPVAKPAARPADQPAAKKKQRQEAQKNSKGNPKNEARRLAKKDGKKNNPPEVRQPVVAQKPLQKSPEQLVEAKRGKTGNKPEDAENEVPLEKRIERARERVAMLESAGRPKALANAKDRLAALEKRFQQENQQREKKDLEKGIAPAPPVVKVRPVTPAEKEQLIRDAYLRTLSRHPDAEELARSSRHIDESADVIAGLRDLMWALMNTKEFIVNH